MEAYNYYINFIDVIKTGRKLWIDIYFITENKTINVNDLRTIRQEIKKELHQEFDSLYVELTPDLDETPRTIMNKIHTRRPDKIKHMNKKQIKNKIKE